MCMWKTAIFERSNKYVRGYNSNKLLVYYYWQWSLHFSNKYYNWNVLSTLWNMSWHQRISYLWLAEITWWSYKKGRMSIPIRAL